MNKRFLMAAMLASSIVATSFSEEPPFKLTGMKLFSDKIINKAEKTSGGFSVSFGAKVGNTNSPGSALGGHEFPENQLVQFFSFQFGPGSAGKKVTMDVFGEKTTIGAEVQVIEVSGEIAKDGSLPARISLKNNWAPGVYRAEFSLDGKPVGQDRYIVKAVKDRTSPIKLGDITIYTMENGKGVERATPKPGDHYLEFHATTTGAKTAGATVTWKMLLLDSSGKSTEEMSKVEVKEWPLENTPLVHSVELPKEKDWPTAKYLLEYSVDGESIGTQTFDIKP